MEVKALPTKNPYEGDKQAVATRRRLFVGYNCLDCHERTDPARLGPRFRTDAGISVDHPARCLNRSIRKARWMPAWGGRITNEQIWMLTAYVRSLSSKDLSTENFTGKTVERTGH